MVYYRETIQIKVTDGQRCVGVRGGHNKKRPHEHRVLSLWGQDSVPLPASVSDGTHSVANRDAPRNLQIQNGHQNPALRPDHLTAHVPTLSPGHLGQGDPEPQP